MSFTDSQLRLLRAPVRPQFVKERQIEDKVLHYLEGWHVISEANRIFGFDGWDRETIQSQCVWQKQIDYRYGAAYLTRVRITVRAGERIIQREGLGSGEAIAATAGQAHERASKAAETDATKRALSTFGNSFGLSLYRDKSEPPQAKSARKSSCKTKEIEFTTTAASVSTRADTNADTDQDSALGINLNAKNESEANVQNNSDASNSRTKTAAAASPPGSPTLIGSEPMIAASLPAWLPAGSNVHLDQTPHRPQLPQRVEKSALTLTEPKRIRSREHLRFVACQPCLICTRTPSQAHHLRFAQPRALGRKVSDEFTVPLCAIHHHELHMRGNEKDWWAEQQIEPLSVAEELWKENSTQPGA
jgi:DNA recombination protein Rad52